MIIIAVVIIVYFIILKYKYGNNVIHHDILNVKFFPIPVYGKIAGWPLSHIIAYAIVTYQYPEYWYHIIFIGIIWELIEYFLSFGNITTDKRGRTSYESINNNGDIEYTTWWDSSTQDIVWNSLGGIIGMALSRIYKK